MDGSTRCAAALAALLAVAASAGCSQGDRDRAQSTADDGLIAAQVRAKAVAIDPATVSLIKATSDGGTVTLTGKVANAAERASIEKAARGVNGVRAVVDDIAVDPSAPTGSQIAGDLALAAKVRAALAAQTGINVARVGVDVHRGVVTLSGTLETRAHRDVADHTARAVSGVVKVVDKITIAAP